MILQFLLVKETGRVIKTFYDATFSSSFLFVSQMTCDLVNSCQEAFSCHVSWNKIWVLWQWAKHLQTLKKKCLSFCRLLFLSLIFVVEDFSSSFTLNVLSLLKKKKLAFTVHEKEISRCRTTGRAKSKKILSSSFLKQHSSFFLCHVVHHRQVSLSCHVICDHFISFRRMKKRTSSSSS